MSQNSALARLHSQGWRRASCRQLRQAVAAETGTLRPGFSNQRRLALATPALGHGGRNCQPRLTKLAAPSERRRDRRGRPADRPRRRRPPAGPRWARRDGPLRLSRKGHRDGSRRCGRGGRPADCPERRGPAAGPGWAQADGGGRNRLALSRRCLQRSGRDVRSGPADRPRRWGPAGPGRGHGSGANRVRPSRLGLFILDSTDASSLTRAHHERLDQLIVTAVGFAVLTVTGTTAPGVSLAT
jgi:hypothetical protein